MKIKVSGILLGLVTLANIEAMEMPSKKQKSEEESEYKEGFAHRKTKLEELNPFLAKQFSDYLKTKDKRNSAQKVCDFIWNLEKEGMIISYGGDRFQHLPEKKKERAVVVTAVDEYADLFDKNEKLKNDFRIAMLSRNMDNIKASYKKLRDEKNLLYDQTDEFTKMIKDTVKEELYPGFTMEVVKNLIEAGAPITSEVVYSAISVGRSDLIAELFEHTIPILDTQHINEALDVYSNKKMLKKGKISKKEVADFNAAKQAKIKIMKNLIEDARRRSFHPAEIDRLLKKLNELQLLEPGRLIELQRK